MVRSTVFTGRTQPHRNTGHVVFKYRDLENFSTLQFQSHMAFVYVGPMITSTYREVPSSPFMSRKAGKTYSDQELSQSFPFPTTHKNSGSRRRLNWNFQLIYSSQDSLWEAGLPTLGLEISGDSGVELEEGAH